MPNEVADTSAGDRPVNPSPTTVITLTFLCSLITKSFDGTRSDLHEFISNCDSAFYFASGAQTNALMAFIISKITGSARAQLRDKSITTWIELKELLLKLYSDKKHYTQLMEELNTIKQNLNENVLSFYNRIDKLCTRLLNSLVCQNENERIGRVQTIKELSIQRFILHSLPDLSRYLRSKEPKTLADALNAALEEERALQISKQGRSFPKAFTSTNRYCAQCKTKSHNTRDCFKNKSQTVHVNKPFQKPANPNTTSYNKNNNYNASTSAHQSADRSQKFCNYCKKSGHLISDCFKRNNKRTQNTANVSMLNTEPSQNLNEQVSQNNVVSWDWA